MGSAAATSLGMERTPDERREILRRFMQEKKLKVASWAKRSGVGANTIYNFLNDESQSLSAITYAKLARTANVPVWRLTGETPELESPTQLWVTGHVEAGCFRDALEWDEAVWYPVDVPIPPRFRSRAKALEVRGPSMNIEYPEGSIVIWVDFLDFRPPHDGDHVIVYQQARDDGIEATVKELRIVNGKRWLWPRSTSPEHQQPIDTDNPGDAIDNIEIKGIVIGDYRIRHR